MSQQAVSTLREIHNLLERSMKLHANEILDRVQELVRQGLSLDVDYTKQPTTITTARAMKTEMAAVWTPRDAGVEFLRMLDAGEIAPSYALILHSQPQHPVNHLRYLWSGDNYRTMLAMMTEHEVLTVTAMMENKGR